MDRRRTFGLISHPDTGKTTVTEKLPLFGGAIQMAGSIKARKAARHTTSDWTAIEVFNRLKKASTCFTIDKYIPEKSGLTKLCF